jgi:hypothetical protein
MIVKLKIFQQYYHPNIIIYLQNYSKSKQAANARKLPNEKTG